MAHRITRSLAAPVRVDGRDGPQEVRCSARPVSSRRPARDASGGGPGGVVDAGTVLRDAHTALDAPRPPAGRAARLHQRPARTRRPPAHRGERPATSPGGGRAARALPTVVDLRDGHRTGFEALVRWAHPDAGCCCPSSSSTSRKDCGLVGLVDGLVLEEALGFLTRHPGARVAVNTSAAASTGRSRRRWPGTWTAADWPPTGSPWNCSRGPSSLRPPSPRRAARPRRPRCRRAHRRLRHRLLHAVLPAPTAGDRAQAGPLLRRRPAQDAGSDRIAAAVARLAGDFGLTSTCEGVETADQARHLARQGWQSALGFHFGVPGPEERWFPAGARRA